MSLSLFGRRQRKQHEQQQAHAELAQLRVRRDARHQGHVRAVAAMCAEAGVPGMAAHLSALPMPVVEARIGDALAARQAFAESGYGHLADKAVTAVATQRFAPIIRSMLVDMTADLSADEIDHRQPEGYPYV